MQNKQNIHHTWNKLQMINIEIFKLIFQSSFFLRFLIPAICLTKKIMKINENIVNFHVMLFICSTFLLFKVILSLFERKLHYCND